MTLTTAGASPLVSSEEIPDRAAQPGPLVRVALSLSYDGTDFHGFAEQPGQRTVTGLVGDAFEHMAGRRLALVCAGRTDTGVHARCQVVHVDAPQAMLTRYHEDLALGAPLPDVVRSLNRQVGPHVAFDRALVVDPGFDARRSATFRRYRYDIETARRIDPAFSHASWHLGTALDLAPMRIAADALIGEHDFAGFCRRAKDEAGPITRRVFEARFVELDPEHLRFEITAKAFCHQMVRAIVGILVSVGRGRTRPTDVLERLRSADRTGAATLAPPQGLCLVAIGYPEEFGGTWS